jgi:hypothetical protein
MRVNANYTWMKCDNCSHIVKIIPGQKFESKEDLAKLFECDCKPKPRRRTPNAT